jgi:hypothetical protein
MKIVCIDPCTELSTADVFDGLVHGLRANGHEVVPYFFGNRFDVLFKACVERKEKTGRGEPGIDALLWASELSLAYVLRHDPEWVIIVSGMFFHYEALKMFRQLRRSDGSPVKVALLLTESPYDVEKEAALLPDVDLAWTNERVCVQWLRKANPETHYLPHAWNPEKRDEAMRHAQEVVHHDVVFVGTGWPERIRLFEAVPWQAMGIDLGLYGPWDLPESSPLRQYVRGDAVMNVIALALYRNAKIGINLFRQDAHEFPVYDPDKYGPQQVRLQAESLGPRSYELAAMGCFHVTDFRAEVDEVFGASVVPTFYSPESLTELLEQYLPDAAGRESIGTLLHQAVSGHSWIERAKQVVADLQHASQREAVA